MFEVLLVIAGRSETVDLVAPCTSIQSQKRSFVFLTDLTCILYLCVLFRSVLLFLFVFVSFLNFIRLGSFLL